MPGRVVAFVIAGVAIGLAVLSWVALGQRAFTADLLSNNVFLDLIAAVLILQAARKASLATEALAVVFLGGSGVAALVDNPASTTAAAGLAAGVALAGHALYWLLWLYTPRQLLERVVLEYGPVRSSLVAGSAALFAAGTAVLIAGEPPVEEVLPRFVAGGAALVGAAFGLLAAALPKRRLLLLTMSGGAAAIFAVYAGFAAIGFDLAALGTTPIGYVNAAAAVAALAVSLWFAGEVFLMAVWAPSRNSVRFSRTAPQ